MHSCIFIAVGAALLGVGLCDLCAQSPTFRYFYDDTNQLIKVLDTSGNLIEYVYDATGNPTQINRSVITPGSLALLNLTPRQGGPGTIVTIDGQGFSTTPGSDIVMFNGVTVTVVTATATELTVNIPAGLTSGAVTVTVGGQTVSSGTIQFTPLPPPAITSLVPDGGITGTAINLAINGTNLDTATFSSSPAGALTFIGAANFISANGLATITGTPGRYAIVATNSAGSSSATLSPANRFIVLDTSGEGDTFTFTVLNTAAPPAGTPDPTAVSSEASSAAVAVLNQAAPPAGTADPTALSNEATTPSVAVLNTAAPPAGAADPSVVANEADSIVATALNQSGSSAGGTAHINAVEVGALASRSIRIAGSGDSPRLISGQTATVGISPAAGRLTRAQLVVNGVPFEPLPGASFETTFTVPFGVDLLDLRFDALDAAGKDASLPVLHVPVVFDLGTQVSGRVLDGSGQPIEGRRVTLEAQGLLAEYFQFHSPLTGLPNLAGEHPVKTNLIPGLNLKNPQHVFGNDPLGLGFGPDYAARYHGEIRIGEGGGKYTFFLCSHKGSRLTIDGEEVVKTAPAEGEFTETSGDVVLGPGWHKIEVLYYETVGAALLDLTWAPPGGGGQAIPPEHLLARDETRWAVSNQAGEFHIANVPSNLDQIQVRIEAEEPVTSAPAKPVPGGVSRIGDVTAGKQKER